MATQLPHIDDVSDPDLERFARSLADTKRERDVYQSHMADMEKSLAVAESKIERLEAENERLKAQLSSVQAQATEWLTVLKGIGGMIVPALKGEKSNHRAEALPFTPPRLIRGDSQSDHSDRGGGSDALQKIADSMRNVLNDPTPPTAVS